MQVARLPENEAARIATLSSLDILDTPRESRFDRYTRISTQIFDVPIALISLVDRNRQWFKSVEGFDGEETPREISFCGHAILGDDVFEVRNARRDPRFRDNPLVLEAPHICYYAGSPLHAPNGHKLGTLCLIDRIPRQLSDHEKTMLTHLSGMVVGEILRDFSENANRPDYSIQTITVAEFFDGIPRENGHSVLLFDIDDVLSAHSDGETQVSPGTIFMELLHDYFPTATSIAHVGDYHFCVLLKPNSSFDEVRAISHLCSDARKLLCFADGHESLTPFVGRISCSSGKYASVADMVFDAEQMILRHEIPSPATRTGVKQFLKNLVARPGTAF
ncbi:MAG: GAF domain-containing protein [Gammaproteobacteria bacterium]|nr:GAF domain-containing protein [Gammaproteobacteria bacterium]